jgi:hypothetical protein
LKFVSGGGGVGGGAGEEGGGCTCSSRTVRSVTLHRATCHTIKGQKSFEWLGSCRESHLQLLGKLRMSSLHAALLACEGLQ